MNTFSLEQRKRNYLNAHKYQTETKMKPPKITVEFTKSQLKTLQLTLGFLEVIYQNKGEHNEKLYKAITSIKKNVDIALN